MRWLIFFIVLQPWLAGADCVNPAGVEGRQIFDSVNKVPLFCDGSNWWIMKVQIAPSMSLLNSYEVCNSGNEGRLHYNSQRKLVEICDGNGWTVVAPEVPQSTDSVPSAFNFTDLTSQSLNTRIVSDEVTLTGFNGNLPVSLSGEASGELQVNGGSWVRFATVSVNDRLSLRINSASAVSTARTMTVTVGGTSDTWSVTTRAAGNKIFKTSGTYAPSSFGGLAGADAACNTAASTAGYAGYYMAVLSDSGTSARDRITFDYPVINACDNSIVELTEMWLTLHESVIKTAGACNAPFSYVITGTSGTGSSTTSSTCDSWTSNQNTFTLGRGDVLNSNWIYSTPGACSTSYHLWCVSQPAPSGSGTANAFSFTNLTNQNLAEQVYSDSQTISGFGGSLVANATGPGGVEISVNGGTYGQGPKSITSGQTLQMRTTTGTATSTTRSYEVSVGTTTSTWTVTTKGPGTQIFYTNTTYTATTIGSLAGGDTICQTEADAQSYGGTWKALLSSKTVNANDRVTISYPVTNRCNGTIVELSNLWNSTHEGLIRRAGTCANAFSYVWTGSTQMGTNFESQVCSDWASSAGTGIVARIDQVDGNWFYNTTGSCNTGYYLWCVSQ